MKFEIFVDYDTDPDIGGQQGIYLMDKNCTHNFSDLIGCKIVDMKFNEVELEESLGHIGKVLILTLEK